jgi:hypothetical protein
LTSGKVFVMSNGISNMYIPRKITEKIQMGDLRKLDCLSLHVHLHPSFCKHISDPWTVEGWFTQIERSIALMWSGNDRYRRQFDPAKPLLQLLATTSNGTQLAGRISSIPGDPLAVYSEFWQTAEASDGETYQSTVYPRRKIAQMSKRPGTSGGSIASEGIR